MILNKRHCSNYCPEGFSFESAPQFFKPTWMHTNHKYVGVGRKSSPLNDDDHGEERIRRPKLRNFVSFPFNFFLLAAKVNNQIMINWEGFILQFHWIVSQVPNCWWIIFYIFISPR